MNRTVFQALNRSSLYLMIATIVVIIFHRFTKPLTVAPDCCELLECAYIWTNGKIPYVDFVELNPPLIIALYTVPTLLAKWLNAHILPTFIACTWLITVVSVLLCTHVVLIAKTFVKLPWALILMVCSAALILSTQEFFGQREQIFTFAFLPFFLLRMCVSASGVQYSPILRMASGIFAAVGACIKPHFLLLPLCLEIYWWRTGRRYKFLSPETVVFFVVVIFYVVQFALWPESPRKEYFEFILPLSMTEYSYYDAPIWQTISLATLPKVYRFVLIPIPILVALMTRSKHVALPPLIIWCLCSYMFVLAQQKAFPYHACPLIAGCAMLLTIESSLLLQRAINYLVSKGLLTKLQVARIIVSTSAAASLFSSIAVTIILVKATQDPQSYRDAVEKPMVEYLLANTVKSDMILFFDTGGGLQFPAATQVERHVGSRYVEVFPFAMTWSLRNKATTIMAKEDADKKERKILQEFATDVAAFRPRLIFIPDHSWPLPKPFSLFSYLKKAGFIDSITSNYRAAASVEGYHVFRRIN